MLATILRNRDGMNLPRFRENLRLRLITDHNFFAKLFYAAVGFFRKICASRANDWKVLLCVWSILRHRNPTRKAHIRSELLEIEKHIGDWNLTDWAEKRSHRNSLNLTFEFYSLILYPQFPISSLTHEENIVVKMPINFFKTELYRNYDWNYYVNCNF